MVGDHEEFIEYEIDLNADCLCGCMAIGRFHKIYRFPNGYGASVVSGSKKEAGQTGAYKILLLKFSSEEAYDAADMPGADPGAIDCAGWSEAAAALRTIMRL